MRTPVALAGILLAGFGGPAASQDWTTFVEPNFGTRVEYPREVFTVHDGPAYRGIGEKYTTSDGRATLVVYSQQNPRRESPRSYLKRYLVGPWRTLDYVRVTRSFFAVSGAVEGTIYYGRCNFSRRSERTVHCIELNYPAREKRDWDEIVTRISRSLEPLDRG
jgi:hypothetical protein